MVKNKVAKTQRRAISSLIIILGAVSIFLGSCSKESSPPEKEISNIPEQENSSPSDQESAKNNSKYPSLATITKLQSGDLMCYATVVDDNNKTHNLGATFEVCEGASKLLNQKVNLTYKETSVNDCQSSEPCGKTRVENLISEVKVANSSK